MPVLTLPSGSGGDAPRRPVDLVLALDRSASMTPDRLPYMKRAALETAERFCRVPGCRVGLVAYSGTARAVVPLTDRLPELRKAISALRAGGGTDHDAALRCAHSLLDPASFRQQAVLLFTDGNTTGPRDPADAAHLLKADGIQVLALGLGRCLPPLEQWITAPAEAHLAVTDRPARLSELMAALTAPLLGTLCDQPQPIAPPELPPELGCGARAPVDQEPCPPDSCFRVPACQGCTTVDLPAACLDGLGRMVYLNVTLQSVCPTKRLAVAVQLTEVDPCGRELPRGTRFFTVPAQGGTVCRDLVLRCIRFVVPEEGSLCRSRCFRARIMANYLDTDLTACTCPETVL